MTYKFVHAADLHLDTPFSGLGRTSPEIAAVLQDASLKAFDALVDLCLRERALFLLLAGDIYDGADRSLRAQLRFLKGLERLDAAGIRTFVVHGNHDPLDGWSAIRTWPASVHVFGSDDVTSRPIEVDGRLVATIHGISYPRRDVAENLALRYRPAAGPGVQIGLLHCNVGSNGDHAAYSPCTLDDLRQSGLDYWALGHIHQRQILHEGHPWVVYPGNLQGRSPKPSEQGPKGALVVAFDHDRIYPPRFEPLDHVRLLSLTQDVAGLQDVPALRRVLADQARALQSEHGGKGLMLRVTLTGRGEVHQDLRRPGNVETLLKDLREEASEDDSFLWWESLDNRCQSLLDREAIMQRGDFSAELLRVAYELAISPEQLLPFAAERFAPLEKAVGMHVAASADDLPFLLAEAEALALEMLEQEPV